MVTLKRGAIPGKYLSTKRRKVLIPVPMITGMVIHTRFGQTSFRTDIAIDPPFWLFPPIQVQRRALWKKVLRMIRQVIVNIPRQGPPVRAIVIPFCKPRNYDTCRGPQTPLRIPFIPDMMRIVCFVPGTVQIILIAKFVYGRRSIA